MSRKATRELRRAFPDVEITRTRGGHHCAVVGGAKIFLASSPSDWRAIHNISASIRRAMREQANG